MEKIEYLDFELMLRRQGKKYQAVVVKSPAGEARHDFSLPFSDLEVENYLLRLGNRQTKTRGAASSGNETAKAFGGGLFNRVFDGEVGNCFLQSLAKTDGKKTRLRIRFRLNEVPKLADLPWEYVYNKGLNRFQALDPRISVVRHLDVQESVEPLKVESPLKILVMISSPDDPHYPELDTEAEWSNVQKALGKLTAQGLVQVDLLEKATLKALNQKLKDGYHVFHFIGHGVFDERQEVGFLLLENENGQSDLVKGEKLAWTLQGTSVRLCVLNACEGARSSLEDVFTGAAQSLVQQGVPAVVAMQFEITDDAAVAFAEGFYGSLAKGEAVDAAVTAARREIQVGGYEIEWGTPVLFLRAEEGYLFDVQPSVLSNPPDDTPSDDIKEADKQEVLLEPPVGTMDPSSRFYVLRDSEKRALELIRQQTGILINVKAPGLSGGSSLLQHLKQEAEAVGKVAVSVDLQADFGGGLENLETFLQQFCCYLSVVLETEDKFQVYPKLPINLRFDQHIGHTLEKLKRPLVLLMDEVDVLYETNFADQFIGMIRGWYNMRKHPKLDAVLVASVDLSGNLGRGIQSPLNNAKVVELRDFIPPEVERLAKTYGNPLKTDGLTKLTELLNGYPYLTQVAFHQFAVKSVVSVEDLKAKALKNKGLIGEFLAFKFEHVASDEDLKARMRGILQGKNDKPRLPDERKKHDLSFLRLRRFGLVVFDEKGKEKPRCELIRIYFEERL